MLIAVSKTMFVKLTTYECNWQAEILKSLQELYAQLQFLRIYLLSKND